MPVAAARRAALAVVVAVCCWGTGAALPSALAAQRVVERHPWNDADGRLMGYYSAALAFSPAASPEPAPRAYALRLGLELSLIPPLSEENRTGGFAKTESTNLAPVLPRPRASLTLPGGVVAEGSWVPPVHLFAVTANLGALALSRTIGGVGPLSLTPRLALSAGTVTGAVTCNHDLFDRGGGDSLYFEKVCHGRESRDQFRPRAASLELTAAPRASGGTWWGGRLRPYVGAGVRAERTRFDVGVRGYDGSLDPSYPSVELRVTRGYGFAGATWLAGGSVDGATGRGSAWRDALRLRAMRFSAELFYAPGSLVTVRTQGSLPLSLGSAAPETR